MIFALRPLAVVAFAAALVAQDAGPAGHYDGVMKTPNREIQVKVDLDRNAGQAWIGHITLDPGPTEIPLDTIAVSGDKVSWKVTELPGAPSFDGSWNKEAKTLTMNATLGGNTLPVELKRTGEAKVVIPEPNAPLTADFRGQWQGSLDTGQQTLRLELSMEQDAEGRAKGTLVSVDQGGVRLPISSVKISGNELTFAVKSVNGSYNGRLNEAKDQISGDWTQAGNSLALNLKRGAK